MAATEPREGTLDPALLAVLANRFDAIVRDMTGTLLRTGHSAMIAVARDFSCGLTGTTATEVNSERT